MPVPIPSDVLQTIKLEKGLSNQEQFWSGTALLFGMVAVLIAYVMRSPMPLVATFAFTAMVVASLDMDEI
ncbi:MAG: hypothetical protein VKJ64_10980 [Leptolyngbyaceae bacterium]|nr:hypothetical protein [Leptolyngbyaceae bacterium]